MRVTSFWFCSLLLVLPAAAQSVPTPCNRTCMTDLADRYLAAMVKHDPTNLPLSKGVR